MEEKKYVIDNPKLMQEWDWEKNNELGLFPNKLTYGSSKKVWWKCSKCGHEWETTPNARTSSKTNCPCCAGKVIVKGVNDLQTLFPNVARRWHPTKNDKQPWEVAPFSNKEAYFICDKDKRHIFKTKIHLVTSGETTCPICSNQKIITGVNDFQTTNPKLMKEWNWTKNNELGIYPTQITKGVNKRVWWKCNTCGNEWLATVGSRAGEQHCGCPKCKKDLSSSFPEKTIAFYLSKILEIEENKKFNWLGNSEIDIYIPNLKLGIEYDGKIWHKNITKDLKKDSLCEKNGIRLVRIREIDCPIYISNSYKIIRGKINNNDLQDCIKKIYQFINEEYNYNFNFDIDIERDYINILSKISTSKKEKSIVSTELIKSWNYNKNKNLDPATISIGAHKKVWWRCEKGHEWLASVYSRSSKEKSGCPYCSNQKVISGENDLQTLYPNIAKEWDYKKNEKQPSQIKPKDNRKYWWICQKCGNSYLSSPAHRIEKKGCPVCGRIRTTTAHYKKILNIEQGVVYDSIKQASAKFDISANSISNCCRGISKTAGGYHWKFIKTK